MVISSRRRVAENGKEMYRNKKKILEGRAKLLLTFEMGLFSAETTLHILFCSVSDPKGYALKENRCLDLKCPKNSFIHLNVTLEFCAAQCKRKSK